MYTASDLIKAVSIVTGKKIETIMGQRRPRTIAYARHIAYYMVRKHTHLSLPTIGRLFNRDHTSILHGIRRIEGIILRSRTDGLVAHSPAIWEEPDTWDELEAFILSYAEEVRAARWARQGSWEKKREVLAGVSDKSVDSGGAATYVEATPGA